MSKRARAPYTKSEDQYLVQYIAKYNPEPSGRKGNTLYRTLEENAHNRWPWAKTHSWQSWREHYMSRQEEFDYKIERQIKKDRESDEVGNAVVAKREPSSKPKKSNGTDATKGSQNGMAAQPHPQMKAKAAKKTTYVPEKKSSSSDEGSESVGGESPRSSSEGGRKRKRGSDGPLRGESKPQKKLRQDVEGDSREASERQERESTTGQEQQPKRTNGKMAVTTHTLPPSDAEEEKADEEADEAVQEEEESPKLRMGEKSSSREGVSRNGASDRGAKSAPSTSSGSSKLPETKSAALGGQVNSTTLSTNGHDKAKVSKSPKTTSVPKMNGLATRPPESKSDDKKSAEAAARGPNVMAALKTISSLVSPQFLDTLFRELQFSEETQNALFPAQTVQNVAVPANEQERYNKLYPDLSDELQNDGLPAVASTPGHAEPFSKPRGEDHDVREDEVDKDVEMGNGDEMHSSPPPSDDLEPNDTAISQSVNNEPINNRLQAATQSPPPSIPAPTRTGDRYIVLSSPEKGPSSSPLAPLSKRNPPRRVDGPFRSSFIGPRNATSSRSRRGDSDSSDDEELTKPPKVGGPTTTRPPKRGTTGSKKRVNESKDKDERSGDSAQVYGSKVSDSEDFDPYGKSRKSAKQKSKEKVAVNAVAGPSKHVSQPKRPEPSTKPSSKATTTSTARMSAGIQIPDLTTPVVPEAHETDQISAPMSDTRSKRGGGKGKGKAAADEVNRRETFSGVVRPGSPLLKASGAAARRERRSLGAEPVQPRRSMSRRESLFAPGDGSDRDRDRGRRSSFYSCLEFPPTIEQFSPSRSDDDMAKHLGFRVLFQAMAKNHGFSEDVVKRVYEECGSFPEADNILRAMREAYQRRALILLGYESDSGPELEMEVDVDDRSAEFASEKLSPKKRKQSSTRPTDLKWVPADKDIVRRSRDVYTPPSRSRAADHARRVANEQALRKAEQRRSQHKLQPSQLQTPGPDNRVDQIIETPVDNRQSTPRTMVSPQASRIRQHDAQNEVWTAEEDEIIRVAEDQVALQAIEARRGAGSVKNRFTELLSMTS